MISLKKVFAAFGLGLLLAGCATESSQTDKIMDQIESTISLPSGASEIGSYARYYTKSENGLVTAVYLSPFEKPDPNDGCSEIMPDDSLKDVPCPETEYAYPLLESGQRVWLEDFRNMPVVFDGGCIYIEIEYDLKTQKYISIACNGEA